MRIEVVNRFDPDQCQTLRVADTNPVLIGSGEGAHVRLRSGYVGYVAASIGNRGQGWELWNHHGRDIKVGTRTLCDKDEYAAIAQGAVFHVEPFELRVFFDPAELNTAHDDRQILDRRVAELVRGVHEGLIRHYGRELVERVSEFNDEYILKLEQDIAQEAARADGFPVNDRADTPLGDHLAGMAVKAEMLARLVARAEERTFHETRLKTDDGWKRLRTGHQPVERVLDELLSRCHGELGLDKIADLTEQIDAVDAEFWGVWKRWLAAKEPPVAVRWYLAVRRLKKEIKNSWYGFGPLEELLEDPTISEIMVVDRDHIFVEKNGRLENSGRRFLYDKAAAGLEDSDLEEIDKKKPGSVYGIIGKIVSLAGRKIDTSEPMVDARMPDGSRVNAVIPPLALKGPCLTIRRFPARRLTVEDLIAKGSLTEAAASFLRAAVQSRRNVIVAGGTGTGKTTMLNCLSSCIPSHERIITVEDTAELQLQKEHVIKLQSRPRNSEGRGEKTIRDLVTNTLRMRPDRIVVGECRGGEALDMLQAMNTGHDGSLTTIHANAPRNVIERLEVLCQQNPDVRLPIEAIHRQIASAIDLIVQLSVVYIAGRPRKIVSEVAELIGPSEEGDGLRIVPLFAREPADGPLRPTGHLATFAPELVNSGWIGGPLDLIRGLTGASPLLAGARP